MVDGRICCDGEAHLNDKSVLLEGRSQKFQIFHPIHFVKLTSQWSFVEGKECLWIFEKHPNYRWSRDKWSESKGKIPAGTVSWRMELLTLELLNLSWSARLDAYKHQEPVSKRRVLSRSEDVEMESSIQQPITVLTAAGHRQR